MLKKLTNFTVNYPKVIIIIFAIFILFFALQIPGTRIDTAIKSQIPENMPARINLNKIEDMFGGTEMIIIALQTDDVLSSDTLARTKEIESRLLKLGEIDKVRSPFNMQDIKGENNSLTIEDTIKDIPQTEQEREKLRKRIKDNDLVYGSFVSKDFQAIAVVGILKEKFKDKALLTKVDKIIKDVPGPEKVYQAGLPFIRAKAGENMKKDMSHFMPLGLLIMLIFLYFCFKEIRGVLLPFVVVDMSIVVSMGLIPLLGWKIQLITIILPVILIAITNDYAIHIIARYQQKRSSNQDKGAKWLVHSVTEELSFPILAAGLTTIAGLLSLTTHIIIPARQLGILAAVGNGVALMVSLFFIPAVLTILPDKKIKNDNLEQNNFIERILDWISRIVTGHPRRVLGISLVIVILISAGIGLIKVDTNVINYFGKESKVVKADNFISDKFGGSTTISVVAEGDLKSPAVMNDINDLELWLKKKDDVSQVTSISKLMREMNQVLHNGDSSYDKIPDSRQAIAQYFMLYSMSDDLDKIVDFNRKHALLTARIDTTSTSKIKNVVDSIQQYVKQKSDSPFILVGGFAHLLSELAKAVVKGQLYSLFLSLVIVAVIVMILFRSFKAGIMAIIPLGLAIICLFGLMGYFNIELNMITALLSSIMVGVGIDYTIHFLWEYKEQKQKNSSEEAVKKTLFSVGRAIIFNALSVVVGFVVLLISNFLPVRFFGFLVTVSITGCLVGALIILPAICIVFEPKFLEAKER